MLNARVTIRRGAAQDSITVEEPHRTVTIDQSRLDKTERNRLRHRLVALFKRDAELRTKMGWAE